MVGSALIGIRRFRCARRATPRERRREPVIVGAGHEAKIIGATDVPALKPGIDLIWKRRNLTPCLHAVDEQWSPDEMMSRASTRWQEAGAETMAECRPGAHESNRGDLGELGRAGVGRPEIRRRLAS